jgi:hypothetical protein
MNQIFYEHTGESEDEEDEETVETKPFKIYFPKTKEDVKIYLDRFGWPMAEPGQKAHMFQVGRSRFVKN